MNKQIFLKHVSRRGENGKVINLIDSYMKNDFIRRKLSQEGKFNFFEYQFEDLLSDAKVLVELRTVSEFSEFLFGSVDYVSYFRKEVFGRVKGVMVMSLLLMATRKFSVKNSMRILVKFLRTSDMYVYLMCLSEYLKLGIPLKEINRSVKEILSVENLKEMYKSVDMGLNDLGILIDSQIESMYVISG